MIKYISFNLNKLKDDLPSCIFNNYLIKKKKLNIGYCLIQNIFYNNR